MDLDKDAPPVSRKPDLIVFDKSPELLFSDKKAAGLDLECATTCRLKRDKEDRSLSLRMTRSVVSEVEATVKDGKGAVIRADRVNLDTNEGVQETAVSLLGDKVEIKGGVTRDSEIKDGVTEDGETEDSETDADKPVLAQREGKADVEDGLKARPEVLEADKDNVS